MYTACSAEWDEHDRFWKCTLAAASASEAKKMDTGKGGVVELTAEEVAQATWGHHPLAVIGEGGFGKVYRAMMHRTPVAIKVCGSAERVTGWR